MIQKQAVTDVRDRLKTLKCEHSGKVREMFTLPEFNGDFLLLVATDRISAFDQIMEQGIPGKGYILTKMAKFWFYHLRDICPNHLWESDRASAYPASCSPYMDVLINRSMIVRKYRVIPFECIVRGHLTGTYYADFTKAQIIEGKTESPICGRAFKVVHGHELPANMQESQSFVRPIFTPSTKAILGEHDENISLEQMGHMAERWLEQNHIYYPDGPHALCKRLRDISIALYEKAYHHARKRNIIIADTKFEFGLDPNGTIVLIDEVLTPDSSRFWPAEEVVLGKTPPSFDKQFLRDWLRKEWKDRTQPPPQLPDHVINGTAQRYEYAYNVLAQ